MNNWNCVLELNENREVAAGDGDKLCSAVSNGADLQIYTEFRHNEHIDTASTDNQIIGENSEFRVVYLIDNRWTAGIMTLRQPISLPDGFGDRSSISLFLYNQDGNQGIARIYLDAAEVNDQKTEVNVMPKYHKFDDFDMGTNAPAHNFIYDFGVFRYLTRNDWQEVMTHNVDGNVISGSAKSLADAMRDGCEIKVGIRGLCDDLSAAAGMEPVEHEVFIQTGYNYYYTEKELLITGTHPLVRIAPSIPLKYAPHNWDYSWIMLRTDGSAVVRSCCPQTLKFKDNNRKFAVRWFVR